MPPITLTKDPNPPVSQTDISPVVTPDGTIVITTKNLNDFIDKMGGPAPLTGLRALQTDADGNLQVSAVTTAELGHLSGVSSGIQSQIDSKAALSHTHAISQVANLQTALDGKQPINTDLTAIAGLTPVNDDIIQRKAGAWIKSYSCPAKGRHVTCQG